jgi:hypothetical protein
MLGLEPAGDHLVVDPWLPTGIDRIELLDIPGRWGRVDAFARARNSGDEPTRRFGMELGSQPTTKARGRPESRRPMR